MQGDCRTNSFGGLKLGNATPKALLFGALAAMPLAAASLVHATVVSSSSSSGYVVYVVGNNTGQSQSQFQIVLSGNQISSTGLIGLSSGGYLNPFSSPSTTAGYHSGTPPVTDIAYTSTTGQSTIANGSSAAFGYTFLYPSNLPSTVSPSVFGMNWGAFNAGEPNIDAATIEFNQQLAASSVQGLDPYEIITATVANATNPTQTTTEYFEVSYTTGSNYKTVISNNTSDTEIISNVGFYLSDTLIPLDQLNVLPNSDFTAAPNLDGTYLPNTSAPTPESASLALFGVGAIALFLLPSKRST